MYVTSTMTVNEKGDFFVRTKFVDCWQERGTETPNRKRTMTTLTFKTTTSPDFGGFRFYVEEGRQFDADDYADAYNLSRSDIDADTIKSVQDATGHMNPGEWLEVTHEA